ncbi:hypothetical protein CAOG_03266 [Capsaspora owczarzaki ATCC 30864]|uniref:Uncharacterized protein n=1 Tax=Capsaspora owczarzaki (strain ATCC 30864) TaxID=595528 RepID=A0A0D2WNZ8_CAPO3|nr:hypothetical protein CAOG_03266 [Capsaspora owczarzaki ATCC 30864]KJE92263.1 hypothetical protein CAOG_003266 [Capsaspora owczarzaki ATCC 30864]|eukprot:XP_004364105.1 hypothetical protein CAOG_03266 [Capsaspora owczarzaki ATCC 30864]
MVVTTRSRSTNNSARFIIDTVPDSTASATESVAAAADAAGSAPEPAEVASAKMMSELRFKPLCRCHEVPQFLRQNFIERGYRGEISDTRAILLSLFRLHNETFNVWTHLVATIGVVALGIYTILYYSSIATLDQLIAFSLFFLSAGACFLLSSIYHLFSCHSFAVYRKVIVLDYMGVFTLILGSFLSGLHFSFHCFPTARMVYQGGILLLCLSGCVLALMPAFDAPQFKLWRVASYVATAGFAVFPLVHGAFLFGSENTWRWWSVLALYGLGLFFYVSKFPESKFRGRFDIFFASHQIWHVCVVLAAFWHYCTLHHFLHRITTESCDQFV